jgi:hypothetical protein
MMLINFFSKRVFASSIMKRIYQVRKIETASKDGEEGLEE